MEQHPAMLLRERIKSISGRQYMDSRSVQGHDLRSLASPSMVLIFYRCHSDHSVSIRHTVWLNNSDHVR